MVIGNEGHLNYFVMYETNFVKNIFLVSNEDKSASEAWDEAVAHIEKEHPHDTAIIIKFERVL